MFANEIKTHFGEITFPQHPVDVNGMGDAAVEHLAKVLPTTLTTQELDIVCRHGLIKAFAIGPDKTGLAMTSHGTSKNGDSPLCGVLQRLAQDVHGSPSQTWLDFLQVLKLDSLSMQGTVHIRRHVHGATNRVRE